MDVVLTTRLHGMVLALKNGVPAVAIDAITGGAKVSCQAKVLEWPMCFAVETVTDPALRRAFDFCLTPEARQAASDCAVRARQRLEDLRHRFIANLSVDNKYADTHFNVSGSPHLDGTGDRRA
jgi:polysaccharide pyruvyl transferase WcaK-like protein